MGEFNRLYKLVQDPVFIASKNWRDQVLQAEREHPGTSRLVRAGEVRAIRKPKRSFGEAEKAFRRAIELEEKTPETWLALVHFFTGLHLPQHAPPIRHAEKAEAVLAGAVEHLPAKESHPALAEMYEALGAAYEAIAKENDMIKAAAAAAKDEKQAREAATDAVTCKRRTGENEAFALKEYEAALANTPNDPVILRMVADFYLRAQDLKTATPMLEKLVGPGVKPTQADLIWGRRQLALIVASQGGYANLQKALKMVEANLATGEIAAEDLRAKATFLALDPRRAKRLEATKAMEQLLAREDLSTTEDRYTVAQVYLALGNMNKFHEHMRLLLAKEPPDLRFVVTYIAAELEHNEPSEAEILAEHPGALDSRHVCRGPLSGRRPRAAAIVPTTR